MLTSSTTHYVPVLLALALASSCTASLRQPAAKTPGNALHQTNLDGKQMLVAFLQDASSSAAAEVTGRQGAGGSLQFLYRQVGERCTLASPEIKQCVDTCDSSGSTCTSPSSSGCQAVNVPCSLPGCCLSSTKSGTRITHTMCYKKCCVGLDDNKNIVPPVPCSSSSASATGPTTAAGSSPSTSSGPKSADGPLMSPDAATSKTSSSSCFAGHALVELESGLHRRMDQLSIGDRVKVGERTFSDVFMFTHKLHHAVAKFMVIRTASDHSISLTPGHYIYVNGELTSAASVKIGDVLELSTGARSPVVSVSETVQTGLFNPQTLHGDIIVTVSSLVHTRRRFLLFWDTHG